METKQQSDWVGVGERGDLSGGEMALSIILSFPLGGFVAIFGWYAAMLGEDGLEYWGYVLIALGTLLLCDGVRFLRHRRKCRNLPGPYCLYCSPSKQEIRFLKMNELEEDISMDDFVTAKRSGRFLNVYFLKENKKKKLKMQGECCGITADAKLAEKFLNEKKKEFDREKQVRRLVSCLSLSAEKKWKEEQK